MKKRSFTLIETIVVVAVIGITMPVLFVIIFAVNILVTRKSKNFIPLR